MFFPNIVYHELMSKKKKGKGKGKKRSSEPRNLYAVAAWTKKSGAHLDDRNKLERKYPHKLVEG